MWYRKDDCMPGQQEAFFLPADYIASCFELRRSQSSQIMRELVSSTSFQSDEQDSKARDEYLKTHEDREGKTPTHNGQGIAVMSDVRDVSIGS